MMYKSQFRKMYSKTGFVVQTKQILYIYGKYIAKQYIKNTFK